MCIVTFISASSSVFLTSNRDEKPKRAKASPPQKLTLKNSGHMLCPKDAEAGGTWIGLKNNLDAGVILNGSFVRHRKLSAYRKSRGLVFLEIIGSSSPVNSFRSIDLHDIEPFTLILFTEQRLFECRWDAAGKHLKELNNKENYIWTSSTLYNKEQQTEKRKSFRVFFKSMPEPSQKKVMDFHYQVAIGQSISELGEDSANECRTVSISSIVISDTGSNMDYHDLQTGTYTTSGFTMARNILNSGAGCAY